MQAVLSEALAAGAVGWSRDGGYTEARTGVVAL
jgi:hypothetical protein